MFIQELKTSVRRPFLVVAFILFSLFLLFYLPPSTTEKSAFKTQIVKKALSELPMRLIIPAINVNVVVQYVGVTQAGAMEVPNNTTDVGWFKLGPRPGEKGSAVIAGHFDGENGGEGVFANLYKLKKGDKLYVKDDERTITTFVVRESRTYDPGYADDVFSASNSAHLNLITCDGVWDGTKKSYSKRLVVFSDITR